MLVRLSLAVAVFATAIDHGTYGLTARHSLAIAVWWILIVAVAFDMLPRPARYKLALLPAAPLAVFALVTLASAGWAESIERAVLEFDRVALYLGVFLLVSLTARRETLAQWTDGLALGTCAIALLALASRCFPSLDLGSPIHGFLPGSEHRLSFPLDYWNGVAIMSALALPLLLRIAAAMPTSLIGAAALTPFPAIGATIYLTSSRGGVAAAAVGTVAFVVLSRRWAAFLAAGAGLAGAVAGVAIIANRTALLNQPASEAAEEQGATAAMLILGVAAALGILWFLAWRLSPSWSPSRWVGWAVAGILVGLAVGGAAAASPVERFEGFKRPPTRTSVPTDDFIRGHLLSASGSGRWQFWEAALDQFEARPLEGHGAGSYEAWWAEHGSLPMFIRDAHSIYLEVLGELGVVGFLALVAFLVVCAISSAQALRTPSAHGAEVAAAAAALAYLLAAGIDWMWELTAVSLTGVSCLALSCAATSSGKRQSESTDKRSAAARVTVLAVAWFVVCIQAVPLLSAAKVQDSQEAARRGDGEDALNDARAARNIMPWASSPYLQLALVHEQSGALEAARTEILDAIDRDRADWRLRLVASRIEVRRGAIQAARLHLTAARRLNPRSPIFGSSR